MSEVNRLKIGEYLVQQKLIQRGQISAILDHSQKTGLRFGEAAIDLGVLEEQSLINLFGPQYKKDFFKVTTEYFPKETKEILSHQQIQKYGALPLGQKKIRRFFRPDKIQLNIGMTDPSDEHCAQIKNELDSKYEFKFYLILPTDWLQIAKKIYQFTDQELMESKVNGTLDPIVSNFI